MLEYDLRSYPGCSILIYIYIYIYIMERDITLCYNVLVRQARFF